MSIWEFDQELHDQAMREDGEVIGLEKGEKRGIPIGEFRKLVTLICKKIKMNQSMEKIAEDLVEEITTIEPIYNTAREFAPDYDVDKILEKINAVK